MTQKTTKLLNPRGYLSWTQVDMWLKSPDRYTSNYILGKGYDLNNSGLRFGKTASEALEGGETTDVAMEALVALLPRYSKREHEIRATFRTSKGDVDLLGLLDTYDPKGLRFREYKTGRIKWAQGRADRHRQLHHYAALIYLKEGRLPAEIWLDWAETVEEEGEVRLTGNIQSFHVELRLQDVLQYLSLVSKVARQIDVEYRKQLKNLT